MWLRFRKAEAMGGGPSPAAIAGGAAGASDLRDVPAFAVAGVRPFRDRGFAWFAVPDEGAAAIRSATERFLGRTCARKMATGAAQAAGVTASRVVSLSRRVWRAR